MSSSSHCDDPYKVVIIIIITTTVVFIISKSDKVAKGINLYHLTTACNCCHRKHHRRHRRHRHMVVFPICQGQTSPRESDNDSQPSIHLIIISVCHLDHQDHRHLAWLICLHSTQASNLFINVRMIVNANFTINFVATNNKQFKHHVQEEFVTTTTTMSTSRSKRVCRSPSRSQPAPPRSCWTAPGP